MTGNGDLDDALPHALEQALRNSREAVTSELGSQLNVEKGLAAVIRDSHAAGSRVAFGEYVRSRSQALLRAAQAMTGNRADAEDLLQATLVKAYQSWDRIDDPSALDTYVRRVMVNTHISGWRRRRVDEYPTDELSDEPTAEDAVWDRDLRDVVQPAIDRLPRQMRAAVMLRFYADMTEPEVAAALGVSVGTAKATVARAVAKLRKDAGLDADSLPSPRDTSLDLSRQGV
jgi:RNA polymerase sigma-70 factor (sigma-E family)